MKTNFGIMSVLFSDSSLLAKRTSVIAVNGDDFFILNPVFIHGFFASCHIGMLFLLLFQWCRGRWKHEELILSQFNRSINSNSNSNRSINSNSNSFTLALFSCLFLSIFNLLVCIYNYYLCFTHGCQWSQPSSGINGAVATHLDLGGRTVCWFTITAYLYTTRYSTVKFPVFLRIWWGIFFVISSSILAIDFLYSRKLGILQTHLAIYDIGSSLIGFFLLIPAIFFAGIAKKVPEEENALLQEPLLNGNENGREPSSSSSSSSSSPNDAAESKKPAKSPFSTAGFFSTLTFSWMGALISTGYKKTIGLEDVPQLADNDSIHGIFPIFKSKLQAFNTQSSATDDDTTNSVGALSLAKSLVFTTWELIAFTGICALINTVASYVGPYLIDYFVQYLNGQEQFKNEGYVLVLAFVLSKFVECFSQRHWFFRLQQAGTRTRSALVAMIYNKGLTLSNKSRQGSTSGEIINLISVDADRVGLFSWYMHDLWLVPVQVTLALLILYANLGLASIAALAATVVVMLANVPLGKMQEKYQEKLMESKDTRMKATSEILRNMRILKLQAWEMKFLSKITELRKKETGWLRKYVYTSAMTTFVFWGAPTFVSVVTFGACMLMGIPLESGKVLSALATFRVLQEPIYNLPDTISMVIQTKVSLDRIAAFLRLDDLKNDVVEKLPRGNSDVAVEVTDGSFSWDPTSESPTLKDLNFQISHGMRVAVCGTVGSGKSSLLSCILGEVPKLSGHAKLCGTVAYVAQSPWIQSGKIEDNILFGKEMDRERYELALEACALKKDLEILPFGDQTVIGERGINLSGGQKQRIQIARALYQDADIFLFDDPFSAVDAHTGSHLFKECLLGLLASKTVIYVTHQVEFLPSADLILVMKHGRITQAGKYSDILDSGTDFMELVGAHNTALLALDSVNRSNNSSVKITENECDGMESRPSVLQKEEENKKQNGQVSESTAKKGQLIQEEEREKGKVGFSVYWKYITTSYRGALVPFILLAQILFQVLQIASNYWMAWAAPVSKETTPPVTSLVLIYVYVALALASSVCVLLRALLLVTAGYKTATILFNKMHTSIFRAPMSFFDSTPSGRILNRASTDQSEVDISIPYQIGSFAFSVIQLLGIIAVMSQVAWQVFAVFVPVIAACIWYQSSKKTNKTCSDYIKYQRNIEFYCYVHLIGQHNILNMHSTEQYEKSKTAKFPVIAACIWYQNYYIATARELSRLIGVCKAPIIQHFSESLSGSTTIRSFNQEKRFVNTNFNLSDAYSRPKFHNAAAMEWLCFRLDMLASMTFAFSLVFLISLPTGAIDPGIAGLAVTYGLNLNMLQSWVIWNLCNLENKIISVERILQYTCIPSEPPLVLDTNNPDSEWPSQGEVDIHDLQVRYAPHMPYVLRGLTCTFFGGRKTGIVGRTGSGKSTLIQTLFRIVNPTVGHILIDGVDISTIGLHDLRSRLSIIPQDPTMFEGTIRSNLDPLEEYSDGQIWEALNKCQLGDEVRRKEGKLDSAVNENGENWSVGQRQLVCLGRVILKRSKVLVLDEATASVDTATDNLIQKTLREQFASSTVITIAHRITSVLDSDMVLLLDNGLIEEYDTPSKLLGDKTSLFSKLVSEYTVRSSRG